MNAVNQEKVGHYRIQLAGIRKNQMNAVNQEKVGHYRIQLAGLE